ncbi:MAG: hypothetical protein LBR46_05260 [Prevotella sp.]|nr:hypothetical protein [Prevotella sp.]
MRNMFKCFSKKEEKNTDNTTRQYPEDMAQVILENRNEYRDIKSCLNRLENNLQSLENLPDTITDIQHKITDIQNTIAEIQRKIGTPQIISSGTLQPPMNEESPIPENKEPKPVEVHYIRRMDTSGNIEIRAKIDKSEALFELTTQGNTAQLRPFATQSSYLIMQQKYLLEPAFDISGAGQVIEIKTPALYELDEGMWRVKNKGKINLI